MLPDEILFDITKKSETFLIEADKSLDGNRSAGARSRKLSLEIEKLLKLWRGVSTGRVSA